MWEKSRSLGTKRLGTQATQEGSGGEETRLRRRCERCREKRHQWGSMDADNREQKQSQASNSPSLDSSGSLAQRTGPHHPTTSNDERIHVHRMMRLLEKDGEYHVCASGCDPTSRKFQWKRRLDWVMHQEIQHQSIWECLACNQPFHLYKELDKHRRDAHPPLERFMCRLEVLSLRKLPQLKLNHLKSRAKELALEQEQTWSRDGEDTLSDEGHDSGDSSCYVGSEMSMGYNGG